MIAADLGENESECVNCDLKRGRGPPAAAEAASSSLNQQRVLVAKPDFQGKKKKKKKLKQHVFPCSVKSTSVLSGTFQREASALVHFK